MPSLLLQFAPERMRNSAEASIGKMPAPIEESDEHHAERQRKYAVSTTSVCVAGGPQTHLSRIDTNAHRRYENRGIYRANISQWWLRTSHYDSSVNGAELPNVQIANMSAICQFCSTTKCLGETSALCCTNGKVRLSLSRTWCIHL